MLSKISPAQLQSYSECPWRCYTSPTTNVAPDAEETFIRDIIKQAYLTRASHKSDLGWETIKNRVNKFTSKGIDLQTEYQTAVRLLEMLHNWYYKEYINDNKQGFVSVELDFPVSKSVFSKPLDLVLMDTKSEHIYPVLFNKPELNIEYFSFLWLFYAACTYFPEYTQVIEIKHKSIAISRIANKLSFIKGVDAIVKHIVSGIENKVYYKCNKCDTLDRCDKLNA